MDFSRSDSSKIDTRGLDFGFGCRPAVFAPLLGKGIFTQEGPEVSTYAYSL